MAILPARLTDSWWRDEFLNDTCKQAGVFKQEASHLGTWTLPSQHRVWYWDHDLDMCVCRCI